jgi:phosphatidylserine decarboxylase
MDIHREGYRIIGTTFTILALVNTALIYFLPEREWIKIVVLLISLVFFILILQFFRYPKRNPTLNDKYVIAPADGKVLVIEQTEEPEFFKDKRIQVSIFMSPLNVHANWYPMSGKVKYLRHHKGKYLVAWHPKSSTENERTTIVIEKESRTSILLRQIAGAVANRIVFYPHEGDMIRQGAELGFIKFGSRVDVFLPLTAKVNVNLNDKTKGGITVLAEL